MRSGELRSRVIIETPYETRTAGGKVTTDWEPMATVWAAIEPLEGSEQLRGMALSARATHRIRIRYRAGVTAAMRVRRGGRVFAFRSVVDTEERHEELAILAEEDIEAAGVTP